MAKRRELNGCRPCIDGDVCARGQALLAAVGAASEVVWSDAPNDERVAAQDALADAQAAWRWHLIHPEKKEG